MTSDFPNLNMSIGEYYKMLMDGKRPTRQRVTKEEVKPLQVSAKPPKSSTSPSSGLLGIIPKKEGGGDLARSQSEGIQRVGKVSSEKFQHRRQLKITQKLKQKVSGGSIHARNEEKKQPGEHRGVPPFQGGGSPLQMRPKSHSHGAGNVSIAKSALNPHPVESNNTDSGNIIAKLRHRDRPQSIEKPKRKKREDGEQAEHKGAKREESRKALQMSQKFEMVEVHPQFCEGRYAARATPEDSKSIVLQKVVRSQVGKKILIELEEEKGEPIDFEEIMFASRAFWTEFNNVVESPEIKVHLSHLYKSYEKANLLITQLVTASDNDRPLFAALLPNIGDLIIVEFKEQNGIFQNAIELDDNDAAYDQYISENSENYSDEKTLKKLVAHAKALNAAYTDYLDQTQRIAITKDNLEEYLFTTVAYSASEGQDDKGKASKQGVFLRAKQDSQDHLIFIKKFGSSKAISSHKEVRSEWLSLSKHRVLADIAHGYVSLDCLTISNSDGSNRLKKRNLQFVGYREAQRQREQLRAVTSLEGQDEPNKAIIKVDSRPGDRCVMCNYQAQGFAHLKCNNCSKVFHEQCLLLKKDITHQLNLGVREVNWRCADCVRCVNCLSPSGKSQTQQLLICKSCNSSYHFECLDPNVKLSMPSNISTPESINSETQFQCEKCVQCEQCGSREAGKNRMNKWSKDFKLCSNCNKKRKKRQYCTICESFWPDDPTTSIEAAEFIKNNMISCAKCQMTVHIECDRIFQDESVLRRFKEGNPNGEPLRYHCQDCRQHSRADLIKQLIDRLSEQDKYYIFQDPVENTIAGYTKIIKTPICFSIVRQKAKTEAYLEDPGLLKSDISLIFENAMKFNLPKHKVHKEAQRLGDVCNAVIDSVWPKLELNAKRTKEEYKFREWLRHQRQHTLQQVLIQSGQKFKRTVSEEEKSPECCLSKDDLFDSSEHQASSENDQLLVTPGLEYVREVSDLDDDDSQSEVSRKLLSGAAERKILRARRNVNYNEDKANGGNPDSILGKRPQESWASEIINRVSGSSKRARFNQQQQQNSSTFAYNQGGYLNLLQQALHQQEEQQPDSKKDGENTVATDQVQSAPNHIQQHQQLMMNYYQEIDDERCYYSNPARCSFDDPSLVFEEMCYLCGSFGKGEDFLSCTLCGESFHTYCLQLVPPSQLADGACSQYQYPQEEDQALIARFQPYWKCLNCKFCELCSSATQEAFLLYCDVCDKAFHSFCLSPPLKAIPKCQWKCQECFKCNNCGTRSFFDNQIHLKPGTNLLIDSIASATDFEFSQNFSLCYECGLNEHKKSFCKICQQSQPKKSDGAQENSGRKRHHQNVPQVLTAGDRMLKCKACGYYCHAKCSRLLPPSCDGENFEEDPEDFKCLECLLTGKSINHLIRETCEHYENMHQIIVRHKLLANLCTEILKEYIPIPEKVPFFIRAFVEKNQNFFRKDRIINQWLALLETGVCFIEPAMEQNEETKIQKKSIEESKDLKKQDWTEVNMTDVYNETTGDVTTPNSASEAYDKMYGHKETFLPPKRNLYEALASEDGYNRFGQIKHFTDPFSPATQEMITLPIEENLQQIDFARLQTEYELQAVMKIKLRFFDWFESTLKEFVKLHTNRLQTKNKKAKVQEESLPHEDNTHELGSFIIHDHESAVGHNEQATYCTEPDVQIDNPQKRLQCIMCKLNGELTVTGRLIPFQVNQFVHVNCALWSTDVIEIADGGYLVNFFQVWTTRAKFTRCTHCNEPGASLFCFSSRHRCFSAYHFPCAYRNKKMAFAPRGTKETFCDTCCKGHRGSLLGLPSEYANTKRRFQIAKNQQPYNMVHHMTSQQLIQQSLEAPEITANGNSTSAADIEKPLQIEKWRPFYFDMFNRVGNLTVLSLRREINHIIEEYCTSGSKQTNINELGDFSTVRIYWRYFNLHEKLDMQVDEGADRSQKAIYLNANNNLSEMARNDLGALLPFVSTRIKEKVQLGLHYLEHDQEQLAQLEDEKKKLIEGDPINQQVFWQKLMQHFHKERAKFSLQNIIFSISEFSGKTKYPVSIWNRAAEGVKNKIFFLRSGEQVLQQQSNIGSGGQGGDSDAQRDGQTVLTGSTSVYGLGAPLSLINAQASKKGEGQATAQGGPGAANNGVATSIDDIFRRMTKINQMGEHQNPMASVKRVSASKHLQYEVVLQNLGKKMFYRAPPANSALFEEPIAKQKQGAGQATAKGIQKKIRQTDTVAGQQSSANLDNATGANKESDLPIAMKYRLSKTQPKRVEVGPSKIHRNGLFTHEDLAGGDIVIEYVGERIRNKVADKREVVYEMKGIGDCYLFRLDKEYIIDATFNGNKARYLNHSCDANCSAKIINVQQQKHIIISANRPIKSGEELTYNYNFDYEADKLDCFCGAPGCLGRLN